MKKSVTKKSMDMSVKKGGKKNNFVAQNQDSAIMPKAKKKK